jgi:hypothetical protein
MVTPIPNLYPLWKFSNRLLQAHLTTTVGYPVLVSDDRMVVVRDPKFLSCDFCGAVAPLVRIDRSDQPALE